MMTGTIQQMAFVTKTGYDLDSGYLKQVVKAVEAQDAATHIQAVRAAAPRRILPTSLNKSGPTRRRALVHLYGHRVRWRYSPRSWTRGLRDEVVGYLRPDVLAGCPCATMDFGRLWSTCWKILDESQRGAILDALEEDDRDCRAPAGTKDIRNKFRRAV